MPDSQFRCVIHGSFRKHLEKIKEIYNIFSRAGIEIIAPALSEVRSVENGFVFFESDQEKDPRMVELLYLQNLKRLGERGFSYFLAPDGYIGKSASYELGIAQISNVRCFFSEKPEDHPAYLHKNSIWQPQDLANYIAEYHALPEPQIKQNEKKIHQLWTDLMVPGSIVAVGGIIEYQPPRNKEKEILLVQTHKWGGRYSIVGGKVRRNERLADALIREVKEETGLQCAVGEHICTFDQIKNSGYYLPGIQQIFVDNVVCVGSRKVSLNDEAQGFVWAPVQKALSELPIEPNARHTVELYARMQKAA